MGGRDAHQTAGGTPALRYSVRAASLNIFRARMPMTLSRLYAILVSSGFRDINALCLSATALFAVGVTLLQYRNKSGNARQTTAQARQLKRRLITSGKPHTND